MQSLEGSNAMTRRRLDPFETDISIEERRDRAPGYLAKLKREYGDQSWDEEITITGISTFDEITGIVTLFALTGRPPRDFDPYRESGQFRTINVSEVQTTKEVSMATKTKPTVTKTPTTKVGAKAKAAKPSKAKASAETSLGRNAVARLRQIEALAMREAGKTFKEITEKLGFANAGAAHNAVKRAKEVAEKK
jgi:hypothetical protein